MTQPAAIYCRSSKDRAEVGLTAQRAELKEFAAQKSLEIVEEFSDMEISGSLDETSRPGLQKLLHALSDPGRRWKTVLALDTSRIARDPMLALYVTHEAEKRGVTIQYAKMPVDSSSAFGETMLSVVRAFDRLHARLSSEKGRAGLTANIEHGFRAGGRAPYGYKLKREETGGLRGGLAVQKSTLVVDPPAAAKVKAFLEARAAGTARHEAAKRSKLGAKPTASLIGIERNALTYAGFTVWNQRRKVKPTRDDPRKRMAWRPRAEWQISKEPTHEPLISRDEAERILAAVDVANPKPRGIQVREPEKFILSGLLFTPDGKQWHGDAHDEAYRAGARGKRVNARYVEGEILWQLTSDFANPKFLARTIAEARRMAAGIEDDPNALDGEIRRLEAQLANVAQVVADTGNATLVGKMQELEGVLAGLRRDKALWAERAALKARLTTLTEEDLRKTLLATAVRRRGDDVDVEWGWAGFGEMADLSHAELRHILTTLVERIVLDPVTRKFVINYRLPVTGVQVASPRGFNLYSGGALARAEPNRKSPLGGRALRSAAGVSSPR